MYIMGIGEYNIGNIKLGSNDHNLARGTCKALGIAGKQYGGLRFSFGNDSNEKLNILASDAFLDKYGSNVINTIVSGIVSNVTTNNRRYEHNIKSHSIIRTQDLVGSLQTQNNELTESKAKLEQRLRETSEELKRVQGDNKAYEQLLAEVDEAPLVSANDLKTYKARITELETEIDGLTIESSDYLTKITTLEKELKIAKSDYELISDAHKQNQTLNEQLSKANKKNGNLEQRLNDLEKRTAKPDINDYNGLQDYVEERRKETKNIIIGYLIDKTPEIASEEIIRKNEEVSQAYETIKAKKLLLDGIQGSEETKIKLLKSTLGPGYKPAHQNWQKASELIISYEESLNRKIAVPLYVTETGETSTIMLPMKDENGKNFQKALLGKMSNLPDGKLEKDTDSGLLKIISSCNQTDLIDTLKTPNNNPVLNGCVYQLITPNSIEEIKPESTLENKSAQEILASHIKELMEKSGDLDKDKLEKIYPKAHPLGNAKSGIFSQRNSSANKEFITCLGGNINEIIAQIPEGTEGLKKIKKAFAIK